MYNRSTKLVLFMYINFVLQRWNDTFNDSSLVGGSICQGWKLNKKKRNMPK